MPSVTKARFVQLSDSHWLRTEHHDCGRSVGDIAAEVGCTPNAVRKALRRHGLEVRPAKRAIQFPQLGDPAWLRERHHDQGRTVAEIAAEVGASESRVGEALHTAGVEIRPAPRAAKVPELHDRAWLTHQYALIGRTTTEIASMLGCESSSVGRALVRAGIPRRSRGLRLAMPRMEAGL